MRKYILLPIFLLSILPEYTFINSTFSASRIYSRTFIYREILWQFSPIDIFLGILFIISIFLSSPDSRHTPKVSRKKTVELKGLKKYAALWQILILLSTMLSIYKANPYPLSFLRPLAWVFVVFFIVRQLDLGLEGIDFAFRSMLFFGFLACVYSLSRIVTGGEWSVGTFYFLPGHLLLFSLAYVFSKYLYEEGSRLKYILLTAAFSLTLLITLIRSVWISLVIIILYLLFSNAPDQTFYLRKKLQKGGIFSFLFSATAVLLILFALVPIFVQRLYSFQILGDLSTDAIGGQNNGDHLRDFGNSIVAVRENWILGAGLGARFLTPNISYRQEAVGFHNSFTTVWFWFGILGAILWISFPFILRRYFRTTYINNLSSQASQFLIPISFAFSAWVWSFWVPGFGFQAWYFAQQPSSIFFGCILGLLLSRSAFREQE